MTWNYHITGILIFELYSLLYLLPKMKLYSIMSALESCLDCEFFLLEKEIAMWNTQFEEVHFFFQMRSLGQLRIKNLLSLPPRKHHQERGEQPLLLRLELGSKIPSISQPCLDYSMYICVSMLNKSFYVSNILNSKYNYII